nr:hypothetical protein [Tanacetum cinerariifolium]
MISNEFAMKLCLNHKVKCRHKVVKKELIVALRGEIYFVKFIINPEEDDVEPGVVLGRSYKRGTSYRYLQKIFYNGGGRPVIGTLTYTDKCKKILDDICIDKMKLDGEKKKEEEEAIIKVKGKALIEKEDPGAFVIPIRLEAKINLNALADTGSDINVMPYSVYKELGREEVGVTTIIIKFLILDMPIDIDTPILIRRGFSKTSLNVEESDGDDEEDYRIQMNSFGAPVHRPKPDKYLNCHNLLDRSIALQEVLNLFRKIYVWKKAVSFLESLPVALQYEDWKPEYTRNHNENEERDEQWHAEIRLTDPYENVYDQGGLRSDEHFNAREYWLSISREENLSLSRSHASTIRKPVLRVLHKIITYGLCQRTTRYDKMQKNDLWLLSMFKARHQNGYANVAWLIARWMKRKGAGSQKESMICYEQCITKIAKRKNLLSEEVPNSLSALIYCRSLDTTTLRELIDSEGRLIPKVLELGASRVAIHRPPRASMQDLYEMMGSIEIRQRAIERMYYRQSYHWDRYVGVFEHIAGVYNVPLQGAYNPPGYNQQQYD